MKPQPSQNSVLRWLDSHINEETSKSELDIINYLKSLTRANKPLKQDSELESYIDELFVKFYKVYVRKGGKEQARKTWAKKFKKLKTKDDILEKARKIATLYNQFAKQWQEKETEMQYIAMCSTFLNANVPD